jgi:catechol 2,3-dioxygenase-like lactoylglutathione lyase family enzyme
MRRAIRSLPENPIMRIVLAFLLFVALFQKESSAQTTFTPSFTALTVKNIDSSIQWYKEVLVLRMRNRVDSAERGFKQAVLINDKIMIELVELVKGISPDSLLTHYPKGTRIQGIIKFGFTVPAIDELYNKFQAKGLKLFGKMVTDPVNQKKTFLLEDPDGNLVQFFEE